MSAEHDWPTDPDEHVWGPWLTQTRSTQYRVCVHPACKAFEEREAPRG